jgi:hypothetical protein
MSIFLSTVAKMYIHLHAVRIANIEDRLTEQLFHNSNSNNSTSASSGGGRTTGSSTPLRNIANDLTQYDDDSGGEEGDGHDIRNSHARGVEQLEPQAADTFSSHHLSAREILHFIRTSATNEAADEDEQGNKADNNCECAGEEEQRAKEAFQQGKKRRSSFFKNLGGGSTPSHKSNRHDSEGNNNKKKTATVVSFSVRMKVKEQLARIIVNEILIKGTMTANTTISGSANTGISVTATATKPNGEDWYHVDVSRSLASVFARAKVAEDEFRITKKAKHTFRSATLAILFCCGERQLLARGLDALLSDVSSHKFNELLNPVVACMGSPETVQAWLKWTIEQNNTNDEVLGSSTPALRSPAQCEQ